MDTRFIFHTIDQLCKFIEASGYRGYDPYDVLNCSLLLWIARHSRWMGVALTQMFRFFPFNIRSFFKIPQLPNAKTMALLVRAYLKLNAYLEDEIYLKRARLCLEWLDTHRSPGFNNACWGYSFPWCTVRQFLERDAPSIVCTSFVAHAFIDAYETWGDLSHLRVARSACDFILYDCPRITKGSTYCFSYSPFGEVPVHNANLLGVSVLSRVYRHTGERTLLEAALPALQYTLNDQNEDGSWYYHGPYQGRDGTIDNFHTGFVLECLREFQENTNYDLRRIIERGQTFYEQHFFGPDGTPYRKLGSPYPVDIRDSAQFLVVLGRLKELNQYQRSLLDKVLGWTFRSMRHSSGYFYFLRWRKWAYSPMYLRWQAWMLWGLVNVLPVYEGHKK